VKTRGHVKLVKIWHGNIRVWLGDVVGAKSVESFGKLIFGHNFEDFSFGLNCVDESIVHDLVLVEVLVGFEDVIGQRGNVVKVDRILDLSNGLGQEIREGSGNGSSSFFS
jgi:hypothetical protein